MSRLFALRRYAFFSAETAGAVAPAAAAEREFRSLDREDFVRAALFRENRRADRFARRIADGHRCWGFVEPDGEVAFYMWLSSGRLGAKPVPLSFGLALEPQEAWYVWDCRTHPDRLRQGLYCDALGAARALGAAAGAACAVISCETRNHASMRGIRKAGFTERARVELLRLGPWRAFRRAGEPPRVIGSRPIPLDALIASR